MINRPSQPVWIPVDDWIALLERAQELRDQREDAERRKHYPAADSARLDPEDLDWAWLSSAPSEFQDLDDEPAPRRIYQAPSITVACCRCGYQWATVSAAPRCSHCKCKAVRAVPAQELAHAS